MNNSKPSPDPESREKLAGAIDALVDTFNKLYGKYETITAIHTYHGEPAQTFEPPFTPGDFVIMFSEVQ